MPRNGRACRFFFWARNMGHMHSANRSSFRHKKEKNILTWPVLSKRVNITDIWFLVCGALVILTRDVVSNLIGNMAVYTLAPWCNVLTPAHDEVASFCTRKGWTKFGACLPDDSRPSLAFSLAHMPQTDVSVTELRSSAIMLMLTPCKAQHSCQVCNFVGRDKMVVQYGERMPLTLVGPSVRLMVPSC